MYHQNENVGPAGPRFFTSVRDKLFATIFPGLYKADALTLVLETIVSKAVVETVSLF